ncbi:tetratricopeptide repeat protein [Flavobacterium sp. ALJ2]|uniref:tetratricopeptide repeat protein n=1 Tax=Flavobacterium sp. ALJ2 TaxID=2786960 RepID=UPI00189FE99D|nr:tetratricopeptide repeat protein [Flavobacterium sp. ALJ2]MBF7090716.1 tetratricopeptide repeat protein [Flavobacterium sp. ALJ2]
MKQIIIIFLLFPTLFWSQTTFEKAKKLFEAKSFDKAEVLFKSALKENPSDFKSLEYLGDIASRNKRWDDAVGYYKKLKMVKPSVANYFYKYGGALGMKALEVNKFKAFGMIDEVREAFEWAIVLNPKHIEARWALIELNLQLPGIVGGSQAKAIEYSNELLDLSPIDGYLSRGHIDEYFKRYSDAERQYKHAIIVSKSKTSYQMLANLYQKKMNQPVKAKAVLDEYKNKQN